MRVQTKSLPRANGRRWQPIRSGFVNLYRYDHEEFHYENGRLLLRGNNGTGKSRVLALQLPFLLDGDITPQRLEPDADPSKRIEWNLLMDRYPDRTGYTWIEFGRSDGGEEFYLTLGCGLSAVEGRPGVRQWFFITSQRIGEDLELVSDGKQVLGNDRLREKIGTAGRVFDSAGAYRRAVDEALFRLGPHRYASLINLLLQLRRPQLTRRLDEQELSAALSEALSPVSSDVIAVVADALSKAEIDRAQLNSSKTALAAVDHFLTGYRRYAEIAAKRRAERVLAAHREYEPAVQEMLNAEAECDRSLAELARLKMVLHDLSAEEHALQTEVLAFHQNSQVQNADGIDRARRELAERRNDVERACAEFADASRSRKRSLQEQGRLAAKLDECEVRLASIKDAAQKAALSAGLQHVDMQEFSSMDAAIRMQLEKLEYARRLGERVASATNQAQRAITERDQLLGLLADAREHLNMAQEEHRAAISSFLAAVSEWTADLVELPLPFDEAFFKSVAAWCDKPAGPNPFGIASRKALEDLTVQFAESRAYLTQMEKTRSEELTQVENQSAMVEAHASIDTILDSLDELGRRETRLRREVHATPVDDAVRSAYEYSIAVSRHVDRLRGRLAEADEYVKQMEFEADHVIRARERAFQDLAIDNRTESFDSLKDKVAQYQFVMASIWPAMESVEETRHACEWAAAQLEEASTREARQKQIAEEFASRAAAAQILHDAAGLSIDHDSAEILRRVAGAQDRIEQVRVKTKETRERYHDTELAVTRLDERLRNRTEILSGETDRRDATASSLLAFASTPLLELAAPGIATSVTATASARRAVELASELVSRLHSVDAGDQVWDQHQKSVAAQFNTLIQALAAQNWKAFGIFCEDVLVAKALFAGRECGVDELRQVLSDDVTGRQMLVDAREIEVFENHLGGRLAVHLRELLRSGEEQVRQMNTELESCPMSTGMRLRFVWQPAEDGPAGMSAIRQRLMASNDDWSPAERQMLGSFLQRQIQAPAPGAGDVSWQESLADALDYRKWHRFGVERYQDGIWKRLTRRTYGTGSGGEKAVALTLPHFAAAAAFYRTADPLAPRLILLDEAFVGIDADMRAKCMGLIHAFDLDFMMTSEREWGCYQTLPGIAIYHLSTRPGIDAIGLTRWVWNGRQRQLRSTEFGAVCEQLPSSL
jgi:hypothetical protein